MNSKLEFLKFIKKDADLNIYCIHGFSSNALDFISISEEFIFPFECNYYMLQAPFKLDENSYAWFPRDMQTIHKVMQGMYFPNMKDTYDDALHDSIQEINDFIKETKNKKNIYIGFSQGAIIGSHMLLENKNNLNAYLLFSPSLMAIEDIKKIKLQKDNLPKIFLSCGLQDNILPYHTAEELCSFFASKDIPFQKEVFNGGHLVPLPVIKKANQFIIDSL